ncbi:MAG: hydrolase [Chloroflexi bacterium]|nr:MAG: hydrolase [Chloroflexota bacterium]
MQRLRVALAQTNWSGSREEITRVYRALAAEAAGRGAGLLCLQEFTLSPYFASVIDEANYAWAEPLTGGESDHFFSQLARTNDLFLVGSIFEKGEDGRYWDTAVLYDPSGSQIGHTRKVHIPQGEGYHENHYFAGFDQFPVHDIAGTQTALPTCYDQWFPELSRIYALNGAEFLFYPTAIGSEPDAPEIDTADAWCTVMRGQAIANGVFIAAANRTGVEGVTFYGSSFVCDPMGNVLAQASRDQTEVIDADLEPALLEKWRRLFPLLKQRRPGVYGRLVEG